MRDGVILPQRNEGLEMSGVAQEIGTIQAQANPFEGAETTLKIGVGKNPNTVLFVIGFELGLQRVGGLRPDIRRWILRPPRGLGVTVPGRQTLGEDLLRRADREDQRDE